MCKEKGCCLEHLGKCQSKHNFKLEKKMLEADEARYLLRVSVYDPDAPPANVSVSATATFLTHTWQTQLQQCVFGLWIHDQSHRLRGACCGEAG
mmetsp:Transcript_30821/g.63842  ORF Transcript_30821/g.63842 Transcript_30821/m.63842 type:complete len:94 (-) Transcript_30821:203-484(-)